MIIFFIKEKVNLTGKIHSFLIELSVFTPQSIKVCFYSFFIMNKKKVLIIEHDTSEASNIVHQFSQLGIENCTCVQDGFLGVQEIIKAHKNGHHFDLIISNLRVPKINGFKLATEFRKKIPDANVPFILMLIEKDKDKVTKIVEGGIKNYLIQPFHSQQLKEELKKIWKVTDEDFIVAATNPFAGLATKPKKKKTEVFSFSLGEKKENKPKKSIEKKDIKISPRPEIIKVKTLDDAKNGSGSSYASAQKVVVCEDMEVGPLDRTKPINGIYFKISYLVHGADKNYFWAEEIPGENLVQLYLLSNSCKKSGMLMETLKKSDFCSYYYSSERYGCDLPGYQA